MRKFIQVFATFILFMRTVFMVPGIEGKVTTNTVEGLTACRGKCIVISCTTS